ncbi:MAG: TonB-dependent receptor plug domain-containing protein, partial [Xanthobacteraceae bacterium]
MTRFAKVGRDGACVPALRRLGYGVSLLAMSAALPAFAQQATTTEPVEGELPTVTVDSGAQFVGDPFTTPSAVSVVGQDDLDTFGGVRIDDVLRSVPGTFTRDSTSNPGIAVNIRGFEGSGRVNMMIDGVRQNFRFVGHEAAGFTYVDPALLAGVDIARGAVSTVGGAGSLVGLANFRTIGVDDIIKPGNTLGALGSVSWGSNSLDWKEMIAGAARISDNAAVAGAVSTSSPGSYENGDGQTVPNTGQDLTSGLLKADFKPTEDSSLKFGAVFYNNDFVSNSYDQNVKNKTFTANYAYDPASELINFRFNTYYNDLTMKYLNYAVTSPAPPSSQAGRNIEDKGWGFDTTNISLFSTGPVNIIAEYGFEFFADDVDSFNTQNPTFGGGVNPSGNSTVGGVFSQTTFRYNIVDL